MSESPSFEQVPVPKRSAAQSRENNADDTCDVHAADRLRSHYKPTLRRTKHNALGHRQCGTIPHLLTAREKWNLPVKYTYTTYTCAQS